jgi:hypothetical protein
MQWGPVAGHPVSDVSYSVAPFIALDETTPRLHVVSTVRSRIHLLSARECPERAGPERVDQSAVPPEPARDLERAGRLPEKLERVQPAGSGCGWGGLGRNARGEFFRDCADCGPAQQFRECGIAAQFAANGKWSGASGTFTNLHYPNQAEVPGLFDSSSQAGSVFYSLRASKMHYLGVTYEYQRLLSYPTARAERDPDARYSFLLHALCDVKAVLFRLWGSAIRERWTAVSSDRINALARLAQLEPGRGRQLELAGAPEQLRHELLARHL